ncbi:MAG: porin [Arcobacteraceae bacterium]|nr:porin [Arcobacteraceae bacterium]
MDSKGKVVLGLAPNFTYGTDAFDDGGESWKLGINVPVAKDIKVTVVSKIVNEEEADSDKGDTGATAIRVDAKVGAFMIGARYAKGYANKGDGNTPATAADKENKNKVLTSYITGTVAGIELGAEYMSKKIDMIGTDTDTSTQKGYFLTASSEVATGFSVGLSYLNLKKGMQGGDDFAPGMIFEKTSITSSTTKDTSAYILPLSYAISDSLTANATYINVDIQGVDATEMDLGLEYGFSDNVTLSVTYGDFDGKTGCAIDDTKNLEVAIAIIF